MRTNYWKLGLKKKSKKERPKRFKHSNLYWPNNTDDHEILELLYELYDIDMNIIKKAHSLSQTRDAASHVGEISFDINQVDSFLNDILYVTKKIQSCHEKYLDNVEIANLDSLLITKRLSQQDIDYLLNKVIEALEKSNTFPDSTKNRSIVSNLKSHLTRKHICRIIDAIIKNSSGQQYHQILDASGATEFVKEIYSIFKEPSKEWHTLDSYLEKELNNSSRNSFTTIHNWLHRTLVEDDELDID